MTGHLDWYDGRAVAVTGGLGFIGSHLAERLVDLGARVTVIDASIAGQGANPYNLATCADRLVIDRSDLRDRTRLQPVLEGVSCVFNLAGQVSHVDSMTDPEFDLELNGRAPLVLLEALQEASPEARIVYASTRQVYGRAQYLPVDEAHPVHPIDVNGIHKRAAEQYHLLAAELSAVQAVVLRLTNTYGPRQLMSHGRQGFIPVFIRTAIEDGTIALFGGGHQVRDANYVPDVVDAFLRAGAAADRCSGQIYNLGGRPSFTLRAFAERLVAITGHGRIATVDWPPDRSRIDIGDFESDYQRISLDLGWEPSCPLDRGLAETVAFYRSHRGHYW